MLSKCVGNVMHTAIRYNLCTFNAFRPLRIAEFKQFKNVYQFSRQFNSQNSRSKTETKIKTDNSATSVAYYSMALVVLCGGLSFAAVPLYRLFCQATSYGGTVNDTPDASKVENMKRIGNRVIKIQFNADTAASMRWNFKPQQYELKVVPGETALAFYTARNPTDVPVIGVSTYNVIPFDAGQYFNKIQCFCFEAQRLNPHEEVDMPVFFYIDPEFAEDPKMENVDTIVLSYTFFESKDGLNIPVPSYVRGH